MKCPKCKHDNREEARFCDWCGHNFQETEQATSIDFTQPHSYTPKFLADKILTTRSAMEGERKRVTVLFADVAGFTSMSEKLDPEQVHQIMDGCFKILMDEIHNHKGTINQFTGDGIMALFGAPVAIENHAQNACQAALSIQSAIKKYSQELKSKSGIVFKMRIGLNSGPVIVGSIGDDLRMDYTAIGDTTNLAARMESMAEPGTVLVSPITYKRVSQQFDFKPLGEAKVKGKEKPLDVYELIKAKVDRPRLGLERQIFSEMIGRDDDLNKLELQVTKAASGEGSIVNVIGEAGIGKSRLIAELRNSSVMKRVTLLEGRAISIGRNLSFHPIINLLKHWANIKEEDTSLTAISKLETAIRSVCPEDTDEIFPFVATLMGMKLSGRYAERVKGIEGEALEKLIFKNVRDLLLKSTELTPLIIVIEDLHWADTSTIELLEALFRLAETRRILFINVFRPNHPETGDRIKETIKEKLPVYYVEIHLQPLNEQMGELLINNMLNIIGLQHVVVDQIIQRAGGNPFFIEEVMRSFIDEGAVVKANGEFKVTEKIDKMVIPHTINDVLMARIDRLDENTRNLVKVASVIGRSFFYRILTEVTKTVDGIDSRLSYLKQIELIRERQRMEELEYLFKHALAQEAAYESILHQKRKDLHLEVAQSIEKIFDKRLHEFYGMLALHYIKGEDYEKAENYLVKAGEEAIRSSASSEALNYYQEGLKLYLQVNKDAADSEKLAMFEKNIATALYNKCRWEEAVEHIDKVLEYWNIPASPNRFFVFIKFIKNIILILAGLDRVFKRARKIPSQRDNEVFELLFIRGTALAFFDNVEFVFNNISGFNKLCSVDWSKSPAATRIFLGTAGMITFAGLSFKLAYKLLDICNNKMDRENIQILMAYTLMYDFTNTSSGDWGKIAPFKETLLNEAIKKGDLWNAVCYLLFIPRVKICQGYFDNNTELLIDKMSEIAVTYDYSLATGYFDMITTYFLLKKGQLSEAQKKAEQTIIFSDRDGDELIQQIHFSWRAQAQILLNDVDGAKESLLKAKKTIDRHKFFSPCQITPFLIAQFMIDIYLLKEAIVINDRKNLSKLKKKAHHSGKKALNKSKKYAVDWVEVLRLIGEYYWIIGKQNKALKWWKKAIKKGEELGARPDLSRTYFEIGKRLLDPDSNYKDLNGITAEEHLERARTMFEEMDLQWDLDELDKVMAAR
ncbi:MAG: AAA family ATPase [Desulfobacteraceae bacterium]|nr:AAA family ATPase [Desulfobacteraceae bacterium]MBC2757279.1 AAA family ATPase [Desulfobacteraceae bacterium]MBC2763929.1 AAA family ATPase [ANME-2 cluster archaeon]